MDVQADGRPAREVLAWSCGFIEPALRSAISGGKAIRPTLALLSAQAVGATAVELVHNFSLVHDDVMDGDLTRRHRRTAWSVFGVDTAILLGDALLTLALDLLAASGHPAAQHRSARSRRGQRTDLTFERRAGVELAECVRMAQHKTGSLMECACAMGARFGAGSQQRAGQLGLAIQHVDDLLGIWGGPAVTGKPVYGDLLSRKKSLPVVAALSSGTPAGRELADLYQRDEPLSGADAAHAAELGALARLATHRDR